MRQLLKQFLISFLHARARRAIAREQSQIIAVTGSVGKTSTKEAIATVLRNRFSVRQSSESYNTDVGLPLTILGETSGYRSFGSWLKIFFRILFSKRQERYEKLVAEFGADKPGDIARLMKVAMPNIGVITAIAPVHLAPGQFRSEEDIFEEKSTLVRQLPKEGWAILNGDDVFLRTLRGTLRAHVLFYGTSLDADLHATDIVSDEKGIRCMVHYQGMTQAFSAPVLGEYHISVLLPAIAVGLVCGMSLAECAQALSAFHLPKGRFTVLPGQRGTTILDSSYNASPEAVLKALDVLKRFPAKRRIAALGTMNELGGKSEELHRNVAKKIPDAADVLVTVGELAKIFSEHMQGREHFSFPTAREAGKFLQSFLREGDVVLVKGSQNNVRMEWLVEAIMKDPSTAEDLLVRQGKAWKNGNAHAV